MRFLQSLFSGRFWHDVHVIFEDGPQALLKGAEMARVFETTWCLAGVEFHCDVDVGFWVFTPRATEPNKDAKTTPRAESSWRCCCNLAMMVSLSIRKLYHGR